MKGKLTKTEIKRNEMKGKLTKTEENNYYKLADKIYNNKYMTEKQFKRFKQLFRKKFSLLRSISDILKDKFVNSFVELNKDLLQMIKFSSFIIIDIFSIFYVPFYIFLEILRRYDIISKYGKYTKNMRNRVRRMK